MHSLPLSPGCEVSASSDQEPSKWRDKTLRSSALRPEQWHDQVSTMLDVYTYAATPFILLVALCVHEAVCDAHSRSLHHVWM